MQYTEYSKIWRNITFAIVSLTFSGGHKALPVFHADRVIITAVKAKFPQFGKYNVIV